jgi:hypothetical protein
MLTLFPLFPLFRYAQFANRSFALAQDDKVGFVDLQTLRYNKTACPGPLKVIAAQPAGNIHTFAAEEQAGYRFTFQGFGG